METSELNINDLVFLDDVPTIYKITSIKNNVASIKMKYAKSPNMCVNKNRLTLLTEPQLEQVKLNDIKIKLITMNNNS